MQKNETRIPTLTLAHRPTLDKSTLPSPNASGGGGNISLESIT
jgi:hypothetical protein